MAVTSPVTTRGIRFGISLIYFSITNIKQTDMPNVYMYRVSLALFEGKLLLTRKLYTLVLQNSGKTYWYDKNEHLTSLARTVTHMPEPIKRIINEIGVITVETV